MFQVTFDGKKRSIWVFRLIGLFSWSQLNKVRDFGDSLPYFLEFNKDEIIRLFESSSRNVT